MRFRMISAIIAGIIAVLVGFYSWRISESHGTYLFVVLSALFSAGVLRAAYITMSWWQHREELYRDLNSGRNRSERDKLFETYLRLKRRKILWLLQFGLSLVLISLIGFLALLLRPDWRRANVVLVTGQYTSQPGKTAIGRGGSVVIENTLKLDPKLNAELQKYVNNSSALLAVLSKSHADEVSSFSSSITTSLLILAVVALFIGGIVFAVKGGQKNIAALTAAGAILTAMAGVVRALVENDHIVSVSHPHWALIFSAFLLLVGVGLGVYGLYKCISTESEDRALFGSMWLCFGGTVMLSAVFPLLFHVGAAPHQHPPNHVNRHHQFNSTHAVPPDVGTVRALKPLINIGSDRELNGHNVDPGAVRALNAELTHEGARPGDVLVLLGSTDCISTRAKGQWKSNKELAYARAHWVKKDLRDYRIKVVEFALPHVPCGPDMNARAVYPYLLSIQQHPADSSDKLAADPRQP